MKTSYPGIIENEKVVKILSKIYDGAKEKLLQIEGKKGDAWVVRERYPSLGRGSLLIKDMKNNKILKLFLESLLLYYEGKNEVSFYFIQEEYTDKNQILSREFNRNNIKNLTEYYAKISHFNSILLDSECTWVLKFHYEGFGLLNGNENFLNFFKAGDLLSFIEEPKWT